MRRKVRGSAIGYYVELTKRARRDLRKLKSNRVALQIVVSVLETKLSSETPPKNLDIRSLEGFPPGWLRLRAGDYRVLFRRLKGQELEALSSREKRQVKAGYVVHRIIDRKDLDRAVETLKMTARRQGLITVEALSKPRRSR